MPAETRAADDDTIIGIDLGTTNSEVVIVSGGALDRGGGRRGHPAVVRGTRRRRCGHRRPQSPQPGRGRPRADGALGQGPDGLRDASADGQGGTPQEVSAFVLKALRERTTRALGCDVRKAVITVPAYFTDSTLPRKDAGMQRLADLRQAARPHAPVAATRAVEANAGLLGGVSAVALDSKDHLWVFQRAPAGKPQLFKFDPEYNLVLEVGPDVTGYQDKAHGMAVDAEDNVWITATNGATVMKLSPEGELLLTLGETGRRGGLGRGRGTEAALAAGHSRLRAERRRLYRPGAWQREPQRHRQQRSRQPHRRLADPARRRRRQLRQPVVRQRGRPGEVQLGPRARRRSGERRRVDRRPRGLPHRNLLGGRQGWRAGRTASSSC